MPKHGNIPPKADYLSFPEWDGEQWLFPSADAIHDAIIAHSGGVDPYVQLRFVDHNSAEVDRDGSLTKPYQSITEAETAIVDASLLKKYQLVVFPGVYTENVTLSPYISIRGVSKENVQIQGSLTLSGPGRVRLEDITLNGTLEADSSTYAAGISLDFDTVDILGAVSITGRGAGSDGVLINNTRMFAGVSVSGAALTVSNCFFYSTLALGTSGSVPSGANLLSTSVKSSYIGGALSITAAATHSAVVRFWESSIAGAVTLTNNGTILTAEFDTPSWPQSTFDIAGATLPVVNRLNLAINRTEVGAAATETIFVTNKDLVRAVHMILAIEYPTGGLYSSILLHAVHNGVAAFASASEVGDQGIDMGMSVGIVGSNFQVNLQNNEAAALYVEGRFFDV